MDWQVGTSGQWSRHYRTYTFASTHRGQPLVAYRDNAHNESADKNLP